MTEPSRLQLVGAEVDLGRRLVVRPAGTTRLSPTEARLLAYLAARPGEPVPQDQLLQEVWGYRSGVRSRTVVTTIERLRRKVEVDPARPQHLVTDGGGYRFEPPVATRSDLVGRDELVRRVLDLAGAAPLVTLCGPGGMGKTWVAREVAAQAASRRFAVAWVDLEGVRTAHEAIGRVATGLGLRGAGVEQLRRALENRAPVVLILDDLDALVPDAADLSALVGVPGVSVLLPAGRRSGSQPNTSRPSSR